MICFSYFVAFGQGYQRISSLVDYKITSSAKTSIPTPFNGSNPIHVQLEADPAGRYLQVSTTSIHTNCSKKLDRTSTFFYFTNLKTGLAFCSEVLFLTLALSGHAIDYRSACTEKARPSHY